MRRRKLQGRDGLPALMRIPSKIVLLFALLHPAGAAAQYGGVCQGAGTSSDALQLKQKLAAGATAGARDLVILHGTRGEAGDRAVQLRPP